ncbi:unnamed protein product [Ranitomeya imitator]|uniref:Roundabout n=1 Tax=Ranitomeya imitator TaxID=111125 RepID=A0ABN9MKZ7_9NEOB|nr:unnamed protein product [Ranitomeya imitator]
MGVLCYFGGTLIDGGDITDAAFYFHPSFLSPVLRDDFRQAPSDVVVAAGEPAVMECIPPRGHPEPTISWKKENVRISDKDERITIRGGKLMISNTRKTDAGMYVCVATNMVWRARQRAVTAGGLWYVPVSLVAGKRPTFVRRPINQVVLADDVVDFQCEVQGDPMPTARWRKEEGELPRGRYEIRSDSTLRISRLTAEDEGTYTCITENSVGKSEASGSLSVHVPPQLVTRPRDQIVVQGRTVTFQCETKGNPPPAVFWQKEGSQRCALSSCTGCEPESRAVMSPLCFPAPRQYRRRAEKQSRAQRWRTDKHGNQGKHRVTKRGPALSYPMFTLVTGIVGRWRAVCVTALQRPNSDAAAIRIVILLFPSQPPQTVGRFSVSPSGELTIIDVQTGDSGYYMCQAISVAGSILAKALLEVEDATSDRVPPIIRRGPSNQTLAADSAVQMQCHVTGNPLPSTHWLKDGQRLGGSDPRISVLDNGTLQIGHLQVTDTGAYVCVATSSTGETTWSGYLEVQEKGSPVHVQLAEPSLVPGSPSKPLVTDVSKNSVTLTWQPHPQSGSTQVSSYIIEAFSQSAGSTWQTVADNVRMEKHTVIGLNPNTIYLFIIRAMNSYGLSDPSPISEPVRTQDISPTRQGVDHRQVQRELGEVVIQLQKPIILTSSTVQVTWTVDRQAQFVQGYRVMYRPKSSIWVVQDVKSPTERTAILVDLKRGTEYEIKIRPYFDEFQGMDSDILLVRTPEEVPSAPPQSVAVVTVGTSNSTNISITWEPPPVEHQNGIIQDYRIWCLGNESRYHMNRTVDGTLHSTLIRGLVPGILYRVEVAAATSAGFGVKSQPITIQIKPSSDHFSINTGDSVSLTEQITDVVKQPAFIAGIGGACWVILMCFSVWIYCRRKKRKEMSHYTASFAYTPAVSFPHTEGSSHITARPGMLATSASNYPWLADSWPATNLLRNGKPKEAAVNCCPGNHNPSERYYNDAGISNYIAQTEKFGTGVSDGPIYSTIDPTSDDMRTFNGVYSPHTTPYATTPVVPYGGQNLHSPESEDNAWNVQAGTSGILYAQPERNKAENVSKPGKQKSMGKPVKTPSLNWTEVLPPPPPANELNHFQDEDSDVEMNSETEEWCPPLPERTYLMENIPEDCPPPPPRGEASSPAQSYGQQSTATLTPSPRDELHESEDIPRLQQFDLPPHPRRMPAGSVPMQRVPSPPPSQSTPSHHTEGGETPRHGHRRNLSQNPTISSENVNYHKTGKAQAQSGDMSSTPPGQKSKGKKKSKSSHYRREAKQGDLPPPPEPPPADEEPGSPHMEYCSSSLERDASATSSVERRSAAGHQRGGMTQAPHHREDEIIPYSKPTFLSRSQMSSNCSTSGSSSSRGSGGSRNHPSGRSKTGDRKEVRDPKSIC